MIYVDDILITKKNLKYISKLLHKLQNHFNMKDLRHLSNFLGIQETQTCNGTLLHQAKYTGYCLLSWHDKVLCLHHPYGNKAIHA